jgi:hypothetical protein
MLGLFVDTVLDNSLFGGNFSLSLMWVVFVESLAMGRNLMIQSVCVWTRHYCHLATSSPGPSLQEHVN